MLYDGPLWFLTCLFIVQLEFYFINKYFNKNLLISLIICSILGFIDSLYMGFRLPWSFDVSLTSVVFYGLGFLFRTKNKELYHLFENRKISLFLCTIFLFCGIIFCFKNKHVEMNYMIFGNIVYFYISSLSFIAFFIIFFITFLNYKVNLIGFIGKNTLTILSLHLIFINCIRGLIFFMLKLPMDLLTNNLYIGLILSVTCIFSFIPICYIINNYFPYIIGKTRNTKIIETAA